MSVFNLTQIIELLKKANDQGVSVSFLEDELSVHVQKGKQIDKALLNELRSNKPFLTQYFKNFANKEVKNEIPFIPKINRDEVKQIPLSFAQERLWFIHQLEGSVQYHLPTVLRIKGQLKTDALEHTLQAIVNRHEVLRTVILEEDGRGFQHIKGKDEWHLNIIDGRKLKDDKEALQNFILQLVNSPFDLSNDYMLRADVINIDVEEHILVVTMHHIASDAASKFVLIKEVAELYSAYAEGRTANLPPLDIQYADYANWQRSYLKEDVLNKKLDYWKNKLDGVGTLQLPTDYPRSPIQSYKGGNAYFVIGREISIQLQRLSQQQGTTLFTVLLAVYKVLLYRYSSQQDICVGTSFARRERQEIEGLIGFFVNTLALRDEVNPSSSFIELLQQVKATTLDAYEHQDIPFEKVVETVVREREPGRNPLFQVMLVWANTPEITQLKLGDLELSPEGYEQSTTKFDITFFITETPNGLQGSVQYSADLYDPGTIGQMIGHFQNLLGSALKDPNQNIGVLPMLEKQQELTLLEEFTCCNIAYPQDKSVVDLFEEQVEKTPYNIALVFEEESFTYRQLNEQSNQLAHHLKILGLKQDSLVPLYVERSAEIIIGMLGIMKAGAAYVPIDMDLPAERVAYVLEDIGSTIVVSSRQSSLKLPGFNELNVVLIDGLEFSKQPTTNITEKVTAGQLAYVIYTSGSTGKPKGVMIEHRSLVDYTFGLAEKVNLNESRSFALVSTIATDLGNTVIYASLLSGGALHVFSKESVSNIEYLHGYFGEHTIDCLKIVPSHWKALCTAEELLLPRKLLVFGGEALQADIAKSIHLSGSSCRVVNHYGPTETTIGKLLHEVQPGKSYNKTIPIGKPFSNTSIYVLSREMQLCPVGVPGQLFIAGDGIARGYFKNEELTKAKFISNPYSSQTGSKMYGTGDQVKMLSDGNIEFMGRVDDQVKIRGYRVELGEIESVLQQNELVSHAVVLAKEDKQGSKRLVAYIVPQPAFTKELIVSYLKNKLPDYMIPSVFVEMEALPLTANGKINRKALPDPDVTELTASGYVAPRNETEAKLAGIWQDVLEVDEIGMHADFFELGGHSLLAVRLISAIRKAFVVEMPIGDIFDYPTVALLAEQVSKKAGNAVLTTIEVVDPRPTQIPLSYSQERLWFIDRLEGSIQYHVPAVLNLKGHLDINALTHALKNIVNRHEALRSVMLEEDGQPYQFIKEADTWELSVIDGTAYNSDPRALSQFIQQLIRKPFDLSKDDMIRATLIRLDKEEHILVSTLHHIASDGWSKSILVKEVMELYNAYIEGRQAQLISLKVQYADYAIWQRTNLQGETFDKKLNYWKEKLEEVSSLQLPTDFKRPAIWSTKGSSVSFKIDQQLSRQLLELGQKEGTTLFMTLLAAFNVLLHRYSGQNDICVGTPIAGRQQVEVEELIGFFVNTLALRNEVQSSDTFVEILQQVRATALEAFEHQEVPFEKVVDSLILKRDLSRNPLFQVMFVLRNTPEIPELRLGDVVLSEQLNAHSSTLFDITLFITENEHGLDCLAQYSTSLYTEQTMRQMMSHFNELLSSIVKKPEQKIGELPIMSAAELHQLLFDFNNTNTGIEYSNGKNIIGLFEEQAESNPAANAVIFGDEKITYGELNQRSNQLAHYLRLKGVSKETPVPIIVRRSTDMITGILGTLKAGGVYIPIDPEYPTARINYMLDDTNAKVIVTSNEILSGLKLQDHIHAIAFDTERETISGQPKTNLKLVIDPNQLAYIIYTSGSTGTPKGVMVEHKNVYSFICWCREEFSSSNFEMVYASTSICFDISIFEIFYTLSIGKPLRVLENGLHIANYLANDSSVLINTVPVVIENLLEEGVDLSNVSVINMAGEPIPWKVAQGINTDLIEVRNLYGPTEDTVYTTMYRLRSGMPVLIGKPVSNTSIYIVNSEYQLCPIGVAGEICISGAGQARGYLNRKDLTTEKFITNPFSDNPKERMYKTGDLGKWLPDGNIDCLGRVDEQVKIRGYRIEMGEIESLLLQSDMVNQAIVLAKKDKDDNKKLIGYYVPKWELVKAKELELHERQVDSWKEIYETEYSQVETALDEEFDIGIWKDSFTGKAIGNVQMKEWLQDIVEVILSEKSGNLLEIGCGTGLIFYQLAGKLDKYIGTDFSHSSINQIKQRIQKGLRDYGPTELKACAAHEIALDDNKRVDTILMNSIVQYFPGEEYMDKVMAKCISLLHGKGRIIIGDVRDNRSLELFKGRLQLQNMAHSVNLKEFKWAVEQEVLKEEELCFCPEYFVRLQSVYPEISHVEIKWKDGFNINELTLYRYNVIIHIGAPGEMLEPNWQKWNELADKQEIIKQLHERQGVIALKDVPNFRLWKERLLNKAASEKFANSIGELINIISKEDEETTEIKEILTLAKEKGYHTRLLLDKDPLKMNLVMELEFQGKHINNAGLGYEAATSTHYTNVPLFSDISLLIQKDIKSMLKQRLPDFMIPTALVALKQLPLTSNGKIDRRFLSLREEKALVNNLNYKAPVTEIEQMLVKIWQELLGVDRIGIYDNFFELGGHSLLAMRVISAIRKELDVELAIKDLFQFTTVSELSKYLEIQLNVYSEEKDSSEFDLLYI